MYENSFSLMLELDPTMQTIFWSTVKSQKSIAEIVTKVEERKKSQALIRVWRRSSEGKEMYLLCKKL